MFKIFRTLPTATVLPPSSTATLARALHPSNVSSGIEGEGVISTMADCPLSRHRGRSLRKTR